VAKNRNKKKRARNKKVYQPPISEVTLRGQKVKLPFVTQGFQFKEADGLLLIHGGKKKDGWHSEQTVFRSAVFNLHGDLVSVAFPKFFNYDERSPAAKTDREQLEKSFSENDVLAEEKADGTLIIRSVINDKVHWRTRSNLDAGRFTKAIDRIVESNETLIDPTIAADGSVLFEMVSGQLILLEKITHADISFATRDEKKKLADSLNVQLVAETRIEDSDLNALIERVNQWDDKEGLVLRYADGQKLFKVKSMAYKKKVLAEAIAAKQAAAEEKQAQTKTSSASENQTENRRGFDEFENEVDILAIRASGDKTKMKALVHENYSGRFEEAALLLLDGRYGPAEEKFYS
jgi:hypothetical protein